MNPIQGLHYTFALLFHRRALQFNRANHPDTLPHHVYIAEQQVKELDATIDNTQRMIAEDLLYVGKIEELVAWLESSGNQTRARAFARQSLEGAALWLRKEIGDVPPPNFRESVTPDPESPSNTPSPGLAGVSEPGSPPVPTHEPPAPVSENLTGVFDS